MLCLHCGQKEEAHLFYWQTLTRKPNTTSAINRRTAQSQTSNPDNSPVFNENLFWMFHLTSSMLLLSSGVVILAFNDEISWSLVLRTTMIPLFLSHLMVFWKFKLGYEWLDGKPYTLSREWVLMHLWLSIPGFLIPFVWPSWERWTYAYWIAVLYMLVYSIHSKPIFFRTLWRMWKAGCPYGIRKEPWPMMLAPTLLCVQITVLTLVGGPAGLGLSFIIHEIPSIVLVPILFVVVDKAKFYPNAKVTPVASLCPMRLWGPRPMINCNQ